MGYSVSSHENVHHSPTFQVCTTHKTFQRGLSMETTSHGQCAMVCGQNMSRVQMGGDGLLGSYMAKYTREDFFFDRAAKRPYMGSGNSYPSKVA